MGASSAHNGQGGRRVTRRATGLVLAASLGLAWSAAPAALAATPAAGGTPATAGQAPAGTVTRAGSSVVDGYGRMFVPHGLALAAGVTPTAADLDGWVKAGIDAAGVTVPLSAAGRFPDPVTGVTANDPGLAAAASVTRALTNRGFVVVLRVVPVGGATVPTSTLQNALRRLATAFRDTSGLIGYELPHAQTRDAAAVLAASSAIAAVDPFHQLWREQAAAFEPEAIVAVNDPTGYLISWPGSGDAALVALTAAADGNAIGWLYPAPATGQPPRSVLARPYPLAVAGSPASFGTDAAGTFSLRFTAGTLPAGQPTPTGWVTAVNLPAAAYPTGYTVKLTGARLLSRPGSALLCLAAEPGATQVSLTVTRATGGSAPAPPPYAGAQACTDPAVAAAASASASPTARAVAVAKSGDSGPLLWALPLLGAALMALLLVVPFRALRRLRVGADRAG
ncbi:hypothetical protein [Pseudofrankia sp. DC12]|uniref:hypothetical protein n=1 Tax=Pseudofrankia sp. DC12 TaxID=683315 RepID=UPI0012F9354D|nr:hypothetical protein [Pseudofrankia sp. DC12]